MDTPNIPPRPEGRSTPPIARTLAPPARVAADAATSRLVEAVRGALYGLAIVAAFVLGVRYGQSLESARQPGAAIAAPHAEELKGAAASPPLDAPLSVAEPPPPVPVPGNKPPSIKLPTVVAASPASSTARTVSTSPLRRLGTSVDAGATAQSATDDVPEQGAAASATTVAPAPPPLQDPLVEAVRRDIAEEQQSRGH